MTSDVSSFASGDVSVSKRPSASFPIGDAEYELRCPKLRVWMAVIERQEDYEAGQSLKPHVQELVRRLSDTDARDDEERTRLLEQYKTVQPVFAQAPTALQLADYLLDFLASCATSPDQRQRMFEQYHSNEGSIDIPHLRTAVNAMDTAFTAWLDEQADIVGVRRPELPEPQPVNRAARRNAGANPSAGKKPARVGKPVRAAR